MDLSNIVKPAILSLVFTVFGMVLFAVAFKIIQIVTPFSIRKEIEDDQNVAMAVLIGSVMVGLSIIIAAAIHG